MNDLQKILLRPYAPPRLHLDGTVRSVVGFWLPKFSEPIRIAMEVAVDNRSGLEVVNDARVFYERNKGIVCCLILSDSVEALNASKFIGFVAGEIPRVEGAALRLASQMLEKAADELRKVEIN